MHAPESPIRLLFRLCVAPVLNEFVREGVAGTLRRSGLCLCVCGHAAPHLRHVPRAFDTQSPEGKALIKESFTSMEIVDCAKKLWNKVKERRHDRRGPLSHDAYQKQCQLGFDGFRAAENDLSVCAFCGPEYSGDVTSASCNASYSDRRAWRPHCRRCGRRVAWGTPAFDVVIVDEAQDLAPVQFDLFAQGILHPLQPRKDARPGMLAPEPGRGPTLYFVGDPCQLIYGWRGARGNAFQGGFRPHVSAFFSLTGSYRFGPEVGEIATRLLRWMGEEASLQGLGGSTEVRYTAGEADGVCSPAGAPYRVRLRSNNNDGRGEADDEDGVELREVTLKELSSECRDRFGCCLTVLCRTNKEIARTVLAAVVVEGVAGMPKFLVRRGASKILNPQHMKRFVDLFHGRTKHVTVDGMLFSSWAEMRQWAEDSEDASLQLLMEMVEEYEAPLPPSTEEEGQEEAPGRRFGGGGLIRLLELLQPFILKEEDGLGGDGGYQIEMSTTHQAKGRSIPAVLVADDFRSPYKPPKGGPPGAPWVPLEEGEQVTHPFWKEESNLVYVAVTRAQKVPLGSGCRDGCICIDDEHNACLVFLRNAVWDPDSNAPCPSQPPPGKLCCASAGPVLQLRRLPLPEGERARRALRPWPPSPRRRDLCWPRQAPRSP